MVEARVSRNINRNWSFHYDQQSNEREEFSSRDWNDEEWLPISLPHTWSTYETTGDLHPFIKHASERDSAHWWNGWGWYRKRFELDAAYADKNVYLEFDGVQKLSKVYVNGVWVDEHKGGFTSFCVNITPHISLEGPNVLAVAVSNRRNDTFGGIPPMTAGNWNVYGGIYRDVRLVIKDKLHIPFQGSARYEGGTYITTPTVNSESARVRVRTFVRNDYPEPQTGVLTTRILDACGQEFAVMENTAVIPSETTFEFDQITGSLTGMRLWSPEDPCMYRVVSTLSSGGTATDNYESPLGFRWFHWDYTLKCLFLNGRRIHLHGTNRHQEYPWLGDAIPKWMHETDLRDIRNNLGHNFIRTCHYTQDPAVYDLCDRLGLLVCEEVPNIKNIRFGNDIQHDHVVEMIRRDRNHPSIIMWSMGNETNCAADPAWARAEDPERIIHVRRVAGRGEEEPHNHTQLEMENLLRCTIRGWHNADVMPLEPASGQHAGHERWQHDQASVEGSSQRGRIDRNGVMWLYADHGADREYVNVPLKHVNPKGWTDAYRVPKLMYYLWQANYADRPMVYVHPYDWTSRYVGTHRDIVVNSNCERVELWMDGIQVGAARPDSSNDHTVVFGQVPVKRCDLRAVGYRGQQRVEHVLKMAGSAVAIQLRLSHDQLLADGAAIAVVHVDIVDADSNPIYGATHDLHFSIHGPGKLVGPAVYISDIDNREAPEGTMYIDAPVTVPIRAGYESGEIRIGVSSPGLQTAEAIIRTALPLEEADGIRQPRSTARGTVDQLRRIVESTAAADIFDMAYSVDDIHFGQDEHLYKALIGPYMLQRNPHVQAETSAFEALLELMVQQLHKDNGIIVADDYNFNVQRFNDCMKIFRVLDGTSFSGKTVDAKKREYAQAVILQGIELDLEEEKKKISHEELFSDTVEASGRVE